VIPWRCSRVRRVRRAAPPVRVSTTTADWLAARVIVVPRAVVTKRSGAGKEQAST